MTDGLTVSGKRELTPSQIGEYIHRAAEIEKDIYTLKEAEKQFKEEAENIKYSEEDICEPNIKTVPDIPKVESSVAEYIGGMIGGLIVSIVALLILALIRYCFQFSWVIFWIIYAVIAVSFICFGAYGVKEDAEKAQQKAITDRENIIKSNKTAQNDYEELVEKCRIACSKAEAIERQAELLHQKRVELEKLRSQFYSIGIIPPDYRTMDCVYGLDHIFRNQLADTVREAILQYEERVFKGQVIKGMGAILSQLQSLGSQMSYLVNDIHTINRNVEFMSQDLSNLADTQSRSQITLDSILEESKATRYANEAIQKHNAEVQKHLRDARNHFGY